MKHATNKPELSNIKIWKVSVPRDGTSLRRAFAAEVRGAMAEVRWGLRTAI